MTRASGAQVHARPLTLGHLAGFLIRAIERVRGAQVPRAADAAGAFDGAWGVQGPRAAPATAASTESPVGPRS
eukprot:1064071-Pyramimonas_sp.AAC.1